MRTLSLTLGPVLLVAACYWLARPDASESRAESVRAPWSPPPVDQAALLAACQRRAAELAPRLPEPGAVIVRPPYVLAGDLSESELERVYRELVIPIQRALAVSFFDVPPDEPVTLVLLSSDASYREYAQQLDGLRTTAYYGYYQRRDRRAVLNVSTGPGTLAHELTHALAHFDFPEMPEWFDEGLASLHEQSEFREDGLRLEGLSNWRLNVLLQAVEQGELQSLEDLIARGRIRASREAIDYGQARFFCLYLQQRQLLEPFYRKFRGAVAWDPTGAQTLCELLGVESLADVDREFREWILACGGKTGGRL